MKITFLGGVGEVTGSKYLLQADNTKILVDCGLLQDDEECSLRNYEGLPIDPKAIDAIVLTHAHIDHTGYIPKLVKDGFKGKIYCSKATYELCSILLPDSASVMENEASRCHEEGRTDDKKATPLYSKKDVVKALTHFKVIDYDRPLKIGSTLQVTLISSEHILGSSFVIISDGKRTLTFSGDLGRPHSLLMKMPPYLKQTDYLVLESTYGDRLHEQGDPIKQIGEMVNKAVAKGGVLIIPAFAVGRTQTILFCLQQLKQKNMIPNIPIYLDSPLAIKATDMFCRFKDEYKITVDECNAMHEAAQFTSSVEESKKLDHLNKPAIIIAGSGMASGGRVLHHFKHFIFEKNTTVLFVGYQAKDTLGRALVDGAQEVMIHGKKYKVNADIEIIHTLSAHADYNEILQWLSSFEKPPKTTFITHGEPHAAQYLKKKIEKRFHWHVVVPQYEDSFELD